MTLGNQKKTFEIEESSRSGKVSFLCFFQDENFFLETNAAEDAAKSTSRNRNGKGAASFKAATKKGFARGLIPERILGASRIVDEDGKQSGEEQLYYIIKWFAKSFNKAFLKENFRVNSEQADIVSAEEAKQKCPYLVFKFYEERVLPEKEKIQPAVKD